MARARNIKPAFFTNDELVELPFETRLLFIGLWTVADREGRLVDRPKKIKMEVFPSDNVDCEKSLDLLESSGFISRYVFGSHKVIEVLNFVKHQSPHSTEKDSALPDRLGFFTVNERTKNGGITGEFRLLTQEQLENNVKQPLGKVFSQCDNALNVECGTLNPEPGLLNPEPGILIPEQPIVERRDATPDRDVVSGIFEYWQKTMESHESKLDAKRIAKIRAALKLGYTPRQLCEAIKGCSLTPHNMGVNDRNTKYNSVELIFRGADHIDRFIACAKSPPKAGGAETMEQRNARITAEVIGGESPDDDGQTIDMEDCDEQA